MATERIRVIGIGNPLMTDDGLGCKVIQLLQQQELPEAVELIDGGCGGLKLLPLVCDCDTLIIVDAADFNDHPGDIRTLSNADFHQLPPPPPQPSGHHFGLAEILQAAQKMNQLPPFILYLMQIKSCHPGTRLTNEIVSALPSLTKTIFHNIYLQTSGQKK